jgi:hypothetical protein
LDIFSHKPNNYRSPFVPLNTRLNLFAITGKGILENIWHTFRSQHLQLLMEGASEFCPEQIAEDIFLFQRYVKSAVLPSTKNCSVFSKASFAAFLEPLSEVMWDISPPSSLSDLTSKSVRI